VLAGAVEVEVELSEDPPPYCASAHGNIENKIGWIENRIFHRFLGKWKGRFLRLIDQHM